jgi:hypothetical protein
MNLGVKREICNKVQAVCSFLFLNIKKSHLNIKKLKNDHRCGQ